MPLAVGTKINGFTVNRVRFSEELSGNLVEMTHDKTGAQLVWMDNGETNKLFCIGFKTLPEDSTGVFHILEHSVLCGSDKFPVKEPFVELLKSSMNTFLNAMTFPDKTIYPVSSRNEQDFMNLTEVYLDAVFAPAIRTNKNIFYQEGWHVELNGEDEEPSYKGVVFNEMKGAMSSVDEVIAEGMTASLYPDNCYGYNSGGDPRVIPSLTYEKYMDMYNRYYHPSNSRIFLDGDVPLDRVLTLIDEYLSKFEKSDEVHDIPLQTPKAVEKTQYYEVSAADGTQNKAMLTMGKIIGPWQDVYRSYAAEILSDVLAGSNEAPLKRALMNAGLCQDVEMSVYDSIAQPGLMLTVKNIEDENVPAIRDLIRRTLSSLAENGISRDDLEASINRYEFRVREPKEPAGLMRCIMSLNTWLHGGDPMDCLVYDDAFKYLRGLLDNGGYEKLMTELLLDEDGMVVLHTLPSTTLGEEMRAEEAEKLAALAGTWAPADKEAILGLNRDLQAWQKTNDTPEQLATLPVLDLSEVSPEPMLLNTQESTVDGVTALYHKAATNGIVHLNLYFKLTDLSLPCLTTAAWYDSLLGVLPTAKHDATSLQQAVKKNLGRLTFAVKVQEKLEGEDAATPVLHVTCSVMQDKLPVARELIHEILTSTDFSDTARIREVVLQADEQARQMCIMGGHLLAMTAAGSHYTSAAAVQEALSGYTRVEAIRDFAANFDGKVEGIVSFLKDTLASACVKSRMIASVTANVPVDISGVISDYPEGTAVPASTTYATAVPMKRGIQIPAQIGYAIMAGSLTEAGVKYDGSALVAANILSYGYLWNVIRVQGGAYGCGLRIGRKTCVSYSYRDPSPAKSLESYRAQADFLRQFVASGERIDKFIISTVAETEPLMSPQAEGARADGQWFSGKTDDMIREERQQILATDGDKLLGWCRLLEKTGESGAICVVAHEEALKACEAEGLVLAD